jgi:hypothetical protein
MPVTAIPNEVNFDRAKFYIEAGEYWFEFESTDAAGDLYTKLFDVNGKLKVLTGPSDNDSAGAFTIYTRAGGKTTAGLMEAHDATGTDTAVSISDLHALVGSSHLSTLRDLGSKGTGAVLGKSLSAVFKIFDTDHLNDIAARDDVIGLVYGQTKKYEDELLTLQQLAGGIEPIGIADLTVATTKLQMQQSFMEMANGIAKAVVQQVTQAAKKVGGQ